MPTLPELRERKYWTQQDLADQMGIHSSQISDWERGIFHPSMRNLRKLCEALGVTPADIDWPVKGPALDVQGGARQASPVATR
jgi:transcriptional regulator with XRE-family HTH domain